MKAAIYTKRDSRKFLELVDTDPPVPKKGEVLIKVRAAAGNPLDWRLKSHHPGVDVAGEVTSIGAGVTRFQTGDAVFGLGKGTFAEYARARESQLAALTDGLTFEQAACIPIAGLTALQGLRDKGKLAPGQKVLINGAAGGVGTFAVQIAKILGAEVTGVCSTRNVEMVRSLGADFVVDYTQQDFALDSKRYDLILDNVGNRALSDFHRVLTPHGRCVLIGAPKQWGPIFRGLLDAIIRSFILRQNFVFFIARAKPDDLAFLAAFAQTGRMHPVIDRRYPLSNTAQAIAYVEEGHTRGKVLITTEP
jgi:NADPH:quinone reductase-like Zn-dependent oxidoreductase